MAGFFISLEGGEGTGKSTQSKRLAAFLRDNGEAVLETREPGGTPAGEELRSLLVNGDPGRWSPAAEALLNNAARDAHLRSVIRPALAMGQTVICDRFMDSTRAYQGHAGGCSGAFISALEKEIVGLDVPNLTLVFDLDPEVGLARARARGAATEDRYERKGLAFHARLREGFLSVAQQEPQRCKVIDASLREDEVFEAVKAALGSARHGR